MKARSPGSQAFRSIVRSTSTPQHRSRANAQKTQTPPLIVTSCEYHTLDSPVQAAQMRAWCKKRAGPIAAFARRVRSACAARVLGLTPQDL